MCSIRGVPATVRAQRSCERRRTTAVATVCNDITSWFEDVRQVFWQKTIHERSCTSQHNNFNAFFATFGTKNLALVLDPAPALSKSYLRVPSVHQPRQSFVKIGFKKEPDLLVRPSDSVLAVAQSNSVNHLPLESQKFLKRRP